MTGAIATTIFLAASLASSGPSRTLVRPFEGSTDLTPNNRVDELVFKGLRERGIEPANVCSDAVFIRRVFLDVLGTLPTAQEARQFLLDRRPDKRRELIDQLLDREEFADYWAMKWCDVLRVKSEFPINLWPNAVQAYHRWIRESIRRNKPYDQFARELLTSSGSNFRQPPVNFYRAVQSRKAESLARTVALTFMGMRADHWPKGRLEGMAAFFAQVGYKTTAEWKEEIVYFDSLKTDKQGRPLLPRKTLFPDGTTVLLTPDSDPRYVFADWLIRADNPWFARNVVNRIWYWLFGRGLIHEPDDIRPDNPPSHPEVLAWLERELVKADYDLKHIYRLILNSKTYQLSCIPRSDDPDRGKYFAYYPLRRLDAEVLIDALCQVTGTHEEYSSRTPEPYTFIPETERSIALADGSITSSFLEMFGRPPRDTGLASERNNRMSAAQRLHLLNSSHIQRKLSESPKLKAILRFNRNPRAIIVTVYLTILSRFPTAEELRALTDYSETARVRGQELITDVAWALVNTPEFLYRH
ncbi:MAG: DUF1553 domain-containing protein [Planctomycetes bacterium]|nr:DUF1553 domain-containing protein [Planctomycetota bacterium]